MNKAIGAVKYRVACDPITLELISGVLRSTMREMEALIERTAMSPFIREKKDFNTSIFAADGQVVAFGGLAMSTNILDPIFERYPAAWMREGDVYWYNDCYTANGAISHTPDQVFVMPVFSEGELSGFVQVWAHFNDIGGMRPGTLSPDCTDILQEGTIIPPVRLARDGQVNDDLLRVFARNSRFPEMLQGDVRALMASIHLGRQRLEEALNRYGRQLFGSALQQLIDRTAAEVKRRAHARVAAGTYSFTEYLDTDGQGGGPFEIVYDLMVSEDSMTLDTSRSSDQTKGPFNYLMSASTPALSLGNLLLEGDPLFMLNAGAISMMDATTYRKGSILQPVWPAPLGLRGVTSSRAQALWLGVMALATGGNVPASNSAYVVCYLRGRDDAGKIFLMTDPLGVGYGGRPYADGNDAIYLVANENYPTEFVEGSFPIRVRRYALAPDSGGPGRWRGGCGVIRELEILAPEATLAMRLDSIDYPPWGVAGGKNGGIGSCVVNPGQPNERIIPPVSDGSIVRRGDIVRVITGGGGGWGHPYDRPVELVLEDVLGGFVGRAAAETEYGVVFSEDGVEIDLALTEAKRADRPLTKLFHRRQYSETL